VSRSGRIAIVLGLFACVVVLVVFAAFSFVGTEPTTVSYLTSQPAGAPVHLVMQTDGVVGTGTGGAAHPTWVSYRIRTPRTHEWTHTSLVELPAHRLIDVTIYQFDSGSPLRNQQWGRVTGTIGGTAKLDGKTFRVINSNVHTVGHTFTVPSLGINVPLLGNKTTAKNFCTEGPCNPATQENHKITFSFESPKKPGNYRFQCFIPCGGGHYAGNGGPMQTLGYMGGFLEVMS
jgi:hypothetical protein